MERKKVLLIIFITALLVLLNINISKAATSGDYTYEVKTDGTVKITDYSGTQTNLTIPSTIEGKKVTELGDKAFESLEAKSVTIPNTVTTLGYGVFYYANIETATIPSSVTSMKTSIFSSSTIQTANINANITSLPNATFMGCGNLKKVTLNKNIKTLELQAFVYCTSLTDLSFLNTVENIGQQCFMYCTSLSNVVIPENIKKMEYGAFDSSVNLDISKTKLVKFGNYYAVGTKITVNGTQDYTKAYEVLDSVNQQRVANGLSKLTMDKQLLEDAMTRASEVSVYYSHNRPTGLSCFSINSQMYGENIAKGYSSSASVMQGWMNSPSHKSNILGSSYKSIGIGCFYLNGTYSWVQCFGDTVQNEATKLSNKTGEQEVYVGDNLLSLSTDVTNKQIKPKESFNITIYNKNLKCRANCAKWTSSNPQVATVDSNGNVQGLKNGVADITVTLGNSTKIVTVFVEQFKDVKKDDWYVSAVNYCYEKGIIRGTTSTTFNPNTKLTRGMLVTILHRIEGEVKVSTANKFSDVSSSQYYYEAVKWAASKGIVHGYDNGNFGPDDIIKRQDVAAILKNYAQYKGKNTNVTSNLTTYKDGTAVSDYAKTAMQWAVGKGVITGNPDNSLTPHGASTRAEAASMIYKYCTKVQ